MVGRVLLDSQVVSLLAIAFFTYSNICQLWRILLRYLFLIFVSSLPWKLISITLYKIIQIVRALWLAIKPFYTSVCKHSFRSSFICYFIKEMWNGFRVYIAWYKHLGDWENEIRDKRRKPRREAEWFPAYRVFSQPPKCLHQAM